MDQSIGIIFFLAAVLVFAAILFAVISLTRRGPSALDIDKYRTKWMAIEHQLNKDEAMTFQITVLSADTLLDQALKEKGVQGSTMGERMKQMQQKWSNANNVWTAHKLRNQIAHEPDVRLSYDTARRALAYFKQALKDIGAI
jgi:transposase